MARTVSPFRTGLFALICLALLIGTDFWLKAALGFEKMKTCAAWFNASLKGLPEDAPVDYLGVPLGRIETLTPGGAELKATLVSL